jgi:hypothetical protein
MMWGFKSVGYKWLLSVKILFLNCCCCSCRRGEEMSLNCGHQRACCLPPRLVLFKLWSAGSAGSFGRKSVAEIISDTEWIIKHTYLCATTAFVGWLSTESRRIRSFHNFLSFSHYFLEYFKLVYKNIVMVTLTTGILLLLFTCIKFWVWGILWRWCACEPTAYEMVRDCRKFEKYCPRWYTSMESNGGMILTGEARRIRRKTGISVTLSTTLPQLLMN